MSSEPIARSGRRIVQQRYPRTFPRAVSQSAGVPFSANPSTSTPELARLRVQRQALSLVTAPAPGLPQVPAPAPVLSSSSPCRCLPLVLLVRLSSLLDWL